MFIGRKIQGYYSVQNASISQRRTLQMIRRSPTADERRIYVLPQHCENILLVFQLGEGHPVIWRSPVKWSHPVIWRSPVKWRYLVIWRFPVKWSHPVIWRSPVMTPCCDLPTFREMALCCDESRQNITRWVAQKKFCLALEYFLLLWWVAPKYYPMSRAKNILFGFRIFSPSCAHGDSSRKYNFWLYLKYVLGNVLLVSRAKKVPMSRGEI